MRNWHENGTNTTDEEIIMTEHDAIDELYDIEKRIHNAYTAHGSDGYDFYTYVAHEYEDELSAEEYEQIVETVEEENLIVYPTVDKRYKWSGASGKAFSILHADKPAPGLEPELEPVLRFKPYQIPEPYEEEDVYELVDSDRNRELIDYFGVRPWEESGISEEYADHDPHSPDEWIREEE